MSDWTANNWGEHPELLRRVTWTVDGLPPGRICSARVDGALWTIRMNDFPDEPLYTLFIDSVEVMHFDDWPSSGPWGIRPK
jgi:hypothetical protein